MDFEVMALNIPRTVSPKISLALFQSLPLLKNSARICRSRSLNTMSACRARVYVKVSLYVCLMLLGDKSVAVCGCGVGV